MKIEIDTDHLDSADIAKMLAAVSDIFSEWGIPEVRVEDGERLGLQIGNVVELPDGLQYEIYSLDLSGRVVLEMLEDCDGEA